MAARLKEYTAEDLKQYNGDGGNPAYVAFQGKVYDITHSKRWKKGTHMNRHASGFDLTDDMAAAPHTGALLDKFPVVGVFIEEKEEGPELPKFIESALNAYPFLKRHPHPITVHYPIVCNIFAAFFTFLFLVTGVETFDSTAYHLLAASVVLSVVAIITGFATWWINYMVQPMFQVKVKIALSAVMFVFTVVCYFWRLSDPTLLHQVAGVEWLYVVLVLSLLPLVSIVGYYGAELTFPTHGGRDN